jgi:uncharacterized membrane protein
MFTPRRHPISEFLRVALAILAIAACSDAPQAPSARPLSTGATANVVIGPSGYAMLTLPLLPGAIGSEANAINDSGDIVGAMHFSGYTRAVRWNGSNGSSITDLGVPGSYSEASASDINNAGLVVGKAWGGQQQLGSRPFLFTPALGMLTIDAAPYAAYANAVSEDGIVVGGSLNDIAWRWSWSSGFEVLSPNDKAEANDVSADYTVGRAYSGAPTSAHAWPVQGYGTSLGWLPGGNLSVANAISGSGWIVGHASYSSTSYFLHAFVWTWYTGMQDLGALAPNYSAADVSEKGRIVGTIWPEGRSGYEQAWTWKDGSFAYLTTPASLASRARGVNSCGLVVGFTKDPNTQETRAVRWMRRACDP